MLTECAGIADGPHTFPKATAGTDIAGGSEREQASGTFGFRICRLRVSQNMQWRLDVLSAWTATSRDTIRCVVAQVIRHLVFVRRKVSEETASQVTGVCHL